MQRQGGPSLIIFRIGSIGDTVVALPCLHAIARQYPGHRRILLTNQVDSTRASSAESVLDGSGLIDGAEYFPPRLGTPAAALSLIFRLRATAARTLVYLAPRTSIGQVRRDLLYFRLAGIREVLGAPADGGALPRRTESDGITIEPEAAYLARTLSRHIPVDLGLTNWSLRLTPAETQVAAASLAQVPAGMLRLALCPGAKWQSKDWGETRWTELVRRMRECLPGVALVLLGAADEHSLAQRIRAHWGEASLNLCGRLTPRESAAVLGQCAMVVCHDSGPMHLATTQGTPCVALFANHNKPRQWFPWGEQHHVIHDPRGIASISVEQVLGAVSGMARGLGLNPGRSRPRYLSVVR